MSKTVAASVHTHPKLPGVSIYPVAETPLQKGESQQVLVVVEPDSVIPLHSHEVDASMFVVDGEAELLSDDPELDGQPVTTGTCVLFEKLVNHGFRVGSKGLKFLSTNGGIVDANGNWDMAMQT